MKKFFQLLSISLFLFAELLTAKPIVPLHVLTVASHATETLQQLQDSCNYYHVNLDILGVGLPYKGNGQKLTYIQQYIENIPNNEIVLFVDAYDCLILADEETIVDQFLSMGKSCVISAETWFCPDSHLYLLDRVPQSPTKFKYLNSGSIIGYAGYLRKLLKAVSPINESVSDQGQLWVYFIDHQSEITLDVNCKLFIPLQDLHESEVSIDKENMKVHSLNTGTTPFVIHGNGGGKYLYQDIYNALFKR